MPEPGAQAHSLLTIGEAARRLGVHISTLRRWADNGDIPYSLTPGGHRRFDPAEVAAFLEQRRQSRRPVAIEQSWAQNVLTVTRRRLAEHSGEPWLGENGGWREQHRRIGRELMGLTLQFIFADEGDTAYFLDEAHKIGRRYGQLSTQAGLSLSEVLSAAIFFHDMLVETALQPVESVRVRPQASLRLLRRINALLNTVHLAIAEEYDARINDALSRD